MAPTTIQLRSWWRRYRWPVTVLIAAAAGLVSPALRVNRPMPWSFASSTSRPAFFVPAELSVVAETDDDFTIDNHPVSQWRPQHQFWAPVPSRPPRSPVLAVATVIADPQSDDPRLLSTYASLSSSSLANWRWFIIVFESIHPQKHSLLRADARITIVRDPAIVSPEGARNSALKHFAASDCPFGVFVHPGDLLEPTALEKASWTLSTVPEWDLVGFFEATHGQELKILHDGVHSGARNMKDTLVRDSTVFRVTALGDCHFKTAQSEKLSFWRFWLCFADRGHWGGTIPELGHWHQPTGHERFQNIAAAASRSWSSDSLGFQNLTEESFSAEVPRSISMEPMRWSPPFDNFIKPGRGKSIMLVQSWLLVGGSEVGFAEILRVFANAGYSVTMVLTRFKYPDGLALRPRVAQYTNDIHVLPTFLRMHDFPPYIKYLIDSRGIDTVFMSNCVLIYEILPSLSELLPHVKFVDYLHNEAFDGWKFDGFPSLSLASRRYLDRTVVCSDHLKDFMAERGYPANRLGVVKLGTNVTKLEPITDVQRDFVKTHLLNVTINTIVLASSARLDTQKRPWLVPDIIGNVKAQLQEKPVPGVDGVLMVMVGEGPYRDATEERIRYNKVEPNVRLLGIVDDPAVVLRGADMFLLPSAIEGISLSIAEAMSLGLPVVTTLAGGLPEQLGHLGGSKAAGGRLVSLTGDEAEDVALYADEVYALIVDSAERRRLAESATKFVRETFDQEVTLKGMFREREVALRSPRPSFKDTPNPAAQFGISESLTEDRLMSDMQIGQKKLTEIRKPGKVGDLQSQCFAETDNMMRWVEAVAEGRACPDSEPFDADYLLKSGRPQCGAWCIWDLRYRSARGWHYNGKCFKYFTEAGNKPCLSWYHLRPQVHFTALPKHTVPDTRAAAA